MHRPGFGIIVSTAWNEGIADSGASRFDLRAGGAFGLLRWRSEDGRRRVQLDLLAGIDAEFDIEQSYDNLGWDGNYGLQAAAPLGDRFAMKLAILHTSSHIGDELIERTGRRRIGYTREEILVGARRELRGNWWAYGEAGYAYLTRSAPQAPWRLQTGLDFDPTRSAGAPRTGWFLGVDLSATEERDYRIDVGVRAGRTWRVEDRRWRLGAELYDGRPSLGEFFQDTESYVGVGIWLDL